MTPEEQALYGGSRGGLSVNRMLGSAPLFQINEMGSAMLYHLKQGIAVKHVRVWLTHLNIHAIWAGVSPYAKRLRAKYPFELRLKRLANEDPEIIDCRKFTAPWDVTIPDQTPPAPRIYPKDTGDPVKDFHPPHVEPLIILDEVQQVEPYGPA